MHFLCQPSRLILLLAITAITGLLTPTYFAPAKKK